MDGLRPPEQPSRGFLGKVANFIQWIVFAFLALFSLAVTSELRKASVPGAPVILLYVTVAAAVLLALAHLPPIVMRLPRKGVWAAYGAILAAVVLFGVYLDQMKPAWERTPEGAREVAERTDADRRVAAERAREDARLRAEVDAQARDEAERKRSQIAEDQLALCKSLQSNIVEISKDNSIQVIEINDIEVAPIADPTTTLNCSGTAVISRGEDRGIDFGIRTTPQGKDLVTMQLH